MCKSKIFLIIVFLFLSPISLAQSSSIKVETIDDSAEEFHSCGKRLGFDRKNETGYIFFYTGERTVMLIDDQLIELNLVSSDERDNSATDKGEKFSEVYSAKRIKVVVEHIVTGNSDNTVQYKGRLKITKGKNERSINVGGWSGC